MKQITLKHIHFQTWEGSMKNFLTKLNLAVLATVVLFLAATSSYAQDFLNNAGGTYNAADDAVIRMKNASGNFTGADQLGVDATTRIPGIVEWANDNAQDVQADLYYTSLATSGTGTKTFLGNAYILLEYLPTGGNRDYTTNSTTITYQAASGNQEIAGENTGNGTGYYILAMEAAGTKEVPTTTTTEVYQQMTHADGDLTINGTLTLADVSAASTAAIVNNNNTFNLSSGQINFSGTFTNNSASGGGVNINGGTAIYEGDYTNTDGNLTIASAATMQVQSAFTRAAGTFAFDDASNFHYTGGTQTMLGNDAVDFVSYGNFFVQGTDAKTAGGNLQINGDLTVEQEVDMDAGGSDYVLTMTDGTASYTGGVEVFGKFNRDLSTAAAGAYTYNNENTIVTFETVPTSFQLDVRQQTAPTQASDIDLTQDINRSIVADYVGSGRIESITLLWEASDEDATFTGDPTRARFTEGYDAGQPMQKLIRSGATYTRTVGADPRFVEYSGGTSDGIDLDDTFAAGGTDKQLVPGSDIIITTSAMTIVAVNDGRWTNPDTWDAGILPTAADNVEIEALVYVGIDGPAWGTLATDNTTDEATVYGADAAANSIQINDMGAGSSSALIIGNEDNGAGYVFKTALSGSSGGIDAGFVNDNVNAYTGNANDKTTGAAGIHGLYIQSVTLSSSVETPIFGTAQIDNSGVIWNWGEIELSE